MFGYHIKEGFGKAAHRRSLILLLYLATLGLAMILAVPVFRGVDLAFGTSGFSRELAEKFDVILWVNALKGLGSTLSATISQFFWAIPLFIVWKVASQVGLVHALQGQADKPFWEGVGRHTVRGLGLAVIFLLLALFLVVAVWIVLGGLLSGMDDPGLSWTPQQYWTVMAVGPAITILILAALDLMHDYARMHLVLRGQGIWESFIAGLGWPFRRFSAVAVYGFWLILGAAFWTLPFLIDYVLAKTTTGGILGAFALQQIAILVRNGVSVGWIGSEVSLFASQIDNVEENAQSEPDDLTAEDGVDSETRAGLEGSAGGGAAEDPESPTSSA